MPENPRRLPELTIPPAAYEDERSREMIRAWIAKEGLHITINFGTWGDDEAISWGILLSDVAKHVSDALQKEKGKPASETLAAIQESFNREIDDPTGDTEGEFVQ